MNGEETKIPPIDEEIKIPPIDEEPKIPPIDMVAENQALKELLKETRETMKKMTDEMVEIKVSNAKMVLQMSAPTPNDGDMFGIFNKYKQGGQ